MEKIKPEQVKVLEDVIGNQWKEKVVKIKNDTVIGLNLSELHLVNNELTTLMESIGSISSLEELSLSSNQLTTLPESIGNLKSLKYLFLGDNQLTALPESIGNLKSLKILNLMGNELVTFPKSIGNLTSLQKLYLGSNKITSLPESIEKFTSLQVLDLSKNKITTLTESIGALSSLEELSLVDNQLSALPESIGNLKSLEELFLNGNLFTELPGSIGNLNLKKFKVLKFEGNPLNQEFKIIFEMAKGDIKFIIRKIIEKELEKKFPIIEKLIQEMKLSDAILMLKDIKNSAKRYNLSQILIWIDGKIDLCGTLGKTESLKKSFPIVEKLIREMKFISAISKLKDIKNTAKRDNLSEIINWTEENLIFCYKPIIKKTILDLGTKYTRLEVREIIEKSDVNDEELIVKTVKNMIDNKEIYAEYFSSSNSISFNQQANIDEIDKLMSTYKDWEEKKIGKK